MVLVFPAPSQVATTTKRSAQRVPDLARRQEVLLQTIDEVLALVEDSPFYLRATYATEHGPAFCEIAYPHRLRWPVLGRMIEMSVDTRPMKT